MVDTWSGNELLLGGYADATQKRYKKAVEKFAIWCIKYDVRPIGSRQVDYHLSRYMLDLWLNDQSKVEASCTLYGLDMMIPGIKSELVLSRRSLRGFNRLVPSSPRPPMPWPVAVAMAMWLAGKKKVTFAIALLLSFDCYLRISECFNLVREDIAFGGDPRLGLSDEHNQRVHVHLHRTKTGNNKGVEVKHGQVKMLLWQLVRAAEPGAYLFTSQSGYPIISYPILSSRAMASSTKETYRRWFTKARDTLGLSSEYTPHSLRHGGATSDYLNGMALADVILRGRWAQAKSATHYIQQGRQLMMLQYVPSIVDEVGRASMKHLYISLVLAYSLSQVTRPLRLRGRVGMGTTFI